MRPPLVDHVAQRGSRSPYGKMRPRGTIGGVAGLSSVPMNLDTVKGRRRRQYVVAAIVFFAALLRISVGIRHNPGDSLYSDMANYDGVAEHIRHGELSASDAFYPIGYPAFLGSVYALTDRNFTVVAILQALLGAATCGLVAMLTVRLSPSTAASLAAATAVTLYPPFIYYSAMLLTESVAPFWFTLSVWLFLRAIEAPTIRRHAFAGVTLAVATVIRPNVLVLYPFIVMVTVHAHKPNRSRGLRTAAQIVGFAAPLLRARLHRSVPPRPVGPPPVCS